MVKYETPAVCVVNISEKCGLHCEHCYLDPTGERDEMTLGQISSLFSQLSEFKPYIIGLEGDHSNLKDVVNMAHGYGLKVSIGASGLCYTPEFIDNARGKIRSLNFSVEGHCPEIQDSFRNKEGLFEKTISNIKYAKSKGLRVSSLCAISNRNADYVKEIADMLIDLKVDLISFIYTSSFGRATGSGLSIEPKKWKKVCSDIEDIRKSNKSATRIVYEPVFESSGFDLDNPCSMQSKSHMAIDARGNVYFCPLLISKDGKHSLGNVFSEGLKEIWNSSPKMKEFEKRQKGRKVCFADTEKIDRSEGDERPACYMYWKGFDG